MRYLLIIYVLVGAGRGLALGDRAGVPAYESLPPHRIMKPLGGRVYVQRYGPMHVAGHGDKGIRRHAGKMVGNAPYTARTVAPAAFTSMTPSTTSPRRRPCPFVHTVTRYPPDEAQSYPLMRTDRRW